MVRSRPFVAAFTPGNGLLADFWFVCHRLSDSPATTVHQFRPCITSVGTLSAISESSMLVVAFSRRIGQWSRCWWQHRSTLFSSYTCIPQVHIRVGTIVIATPASSFGQNRIYIDLGFVWAKLTLRAIFRGAKYGQKNKYPKPLIRSFQMFLPLAASATCKLFIYFLNDHSNFIYFYISYRLVFRLNKKGFCLYDVHCYEGDQERKHHHDWRPVVSCSVWGSSRYI